jgi:hypothetical protein
VNYHLREAGLGSQLDSVLAADVYVHAGFARVESDIEAARLGVAEMIEGLQEEGWRAELVEAERAYSEDPTAENWSRLQQCMVTAHRQDQNNREKNYPESVTVGASKI